MSIPYYMYMHACTNLNCCSCDSRGDHVSLFSQFYTLELFGVTITSTTVTTVINFYLFGDGDRHRLHPMGEGYACMSTSPE